MNMPEGHQILQTIHLAVRDAFPPPSEILRAIREGATDPGVSILRKRLESLFAAAKKVPIVRRSDAPPFSTCLGCGSVDDNPCAPECWAARLDRAVFDAKAILE